MNEPLTGAALPLPERLLAWLSAVWTTEFASDLLQAVILLVAGLVLARLARLAVTRTLARRLSRQQLMLTRRAVSYTLLGLFVASALNALNFNLSVLLGAAGILTVALGFASQTSASNLISGLFLVLEGAIEVGDVIKVDAVTGEVLSVDLLSTKLRTFDNLLVRIPNETMVKTNIINYNRFPIRRFDLQIGVAYKEDLKQVAQVLRDVAAKNPLCLDEPAPLVMAQGFGESSVNYQFSVWAKSENWLELRNRMQLEVKAAFDEAGIEIPFPHRSLISDRMSEPFPVRLITSPQAAPDAQEES